jgi:hypothetical protein
VRLERGGRPWDIPPALGSVLADLGAAAMAGDAAAIRRALAPDCAWDDGYAAQLREARFEGHRVVAFASLGHQRLAKLKLDGPRGSVTLIARLAVTDGSWRAVVLEPAAFELAQPA